MSEPRRRAQKMINLWKRMRNLPRKRGAGAITNTQLSKTLHLSCTTAVRLAPARHQRGEQVNNRYERYEAVDAQSVVFTISAPCSLICGAKLKASEKQRSSAMPFCRKAECADSTMPTEPQA